MKLVDVDELLGKLTDIKHSHKHAIEKASIYECMGAVRRMVEHSPWHKIDWEDLNSITDHTLLFRDDEGLCHVGTLGAEEDGEAYFFEDGELWDDGCEELVEWMEIPE